MGGRLWACGMAGSLGLTGLVGGRLAGDFDVEGFSAIPVDRDKPDLLALPKALGIGWGHGLPVLALWQAIALEQYRLKLATLPILGVLDLPKAATLARILDSAGLMAIVATYLRDWLPYLADLNHDLPAFDNQYNGL